MGGTEMAVSNAVPIVVDTPPTSLAARNRVVVFVGDDESAAALRTGFEGMSQMLELRRGNIRNAIRLLEDDTNLLAIVADISGIDNPIATLDDLARVCPADVHVALLGDHSDIAFYP